VSARLNSARGPRHRFCAVGFLPVEALRTHGMRGMSWLPANPAANDCPVYNYYQGAAQPSSCTSTPSQASSGNNGTVAGYFYQDNQNTALSHTASFTYDALARLTQATATPFGSGTVNYNLPLYYTADSSNGQYGNVSCNPVGNPSGVTCPSLTFDASTNRLTKIGSASTSFDATGDMTSDGNGNQYQWDAEGRLAYASNGSWYQSTVYNALGQLAANTYPYGSSTLSEIFPRGKDGDEMEEFCYEPGVPWAGACVWYGQVAGQRMEMGGGTTWLAHLNVVGSELMETDQTGAVTWDMDYYPFGQYWYNSNGRISVLFAGMDWQVNDPMEPSATRQLNPSLYRWLSPDAVGGDIMNPQSLNRYAYALNNPTTLNDPTGLDSCFMDSCGVGADAATAVGAIIGGPIGALIGSLFHLFGLFGGGPPPPPPAGQPPLAGGGGEGYMPVGVGGGEINPEILIGIIDLAPLAPGVYITPDGVVISVWTIGHKSSAFARWAAPAVAAASAFFSIQAQEDALNSGYYACVASGGATMSNARAAFGQGLETGAEQGAKAAAPKIAGAWYHFTDARFTAWGASSKVIVPRAAEAIGRAVDVAGWAYTDYDLAMGLFRCHP
jgi:RHS repeat-associated protein